MIRMHNVSKTYRAGGEDVTAVAGISLHIPRGKVTILAGPNGSGKTTLLSLMVGIISPSSGRIFFDDQDLARLPERFVSKIRRERTGIVFQERYLMRDTTVIENLAVPLIPTEMSHSEVYAKAKSMLSRFGLEGKEGTRVNAISGGQKQRLTIARALVNDPDVIIADEPTTHLDEELLGMFAQYIIDWKRLGKTIVIATHDPSLLSGIQVDQAVRISQGRIQEANP
jgi:putative ABC transport system ATP-binding protein